MSSHESQDQAASWTRRQQAQALGDVPHSRDLTSIVALLGGFGLLSLCAAECWTGLEQIARTQWTWSGQIGGADGARTLMSRVFLPAVQPVGWLIGGMFLVAFGAGWIQNGCGWYWGRLRPDWGRLRGGFSSGRTGGWFGSVLGITRWLVLWSAVVACLWWSRDELIAVGGASREQWLPAAGQLVLTIMLRVAAAVGALALVDYGWQRWCYERRLRMTPQQVQDELRAAQIDPYLAQRRASAARSFVADSIMRAIRASDIVLTDETGATVGLALVDDGRSAKVRLRAGYSQAEGILRIALSQGIQCERHSVAGRLFARCIVDAEVPPDLWSTIEAILAQNRVADRTRSAS